VGSQGDGVGFEEGGAHVRVWFVTKGSTSPPKSRLQPRKLGSMRRVVVALIALAAVGAIAAGCGSNDSGSGGGGGASSTGGAAATVAVTSSKVGMILVDGNGRTLYLFQKDQPNQSACSGACASAWPVDQSNGTPKAGNGVTASLLGTIKRGDGTTQVTYNKHPLYFFSGDSSAGQQNGQGVNAFGALWYVVSPAGNAVV
jgi:predicted lipoprotein with Yx(FWY)xxD motif